MAKKTNKLVGKIFQTKAGKAKILSVKQNEATGKLWYKVFRDWAGVTEFSEEEIRGFIGQNSWREIK